MSPSGDTLTLFLAGDVMTGRGMDQVMPASVDPRLHERFVKDARRYVRLAERAHGPVPAPVDHAYPWGDALEALERAGTDVRVVNLETAVTTCDTPWRGKGIHYRMHPRNAAVLSAAGLDVCTLANNHVADWGREGLVETLEVLEAEGVATAGAGRDRRQALAPAAAPAPGGRVLVFSLGSPTAGVPRDWEAGPGRPGVALLPDLSRGAAERLADRTRRARRDGDVVVVSLHWGGNWGYRVPEAQRRFARRLVEEGGADVVHGHSSHHPKGLEVHRGRPILYGCGDLLNDYEGIGGHERYRPELVVLWLATLEAGSGRLRRLELVPLHLRRFRLQRASPDDVAWLGGTLDRESRKLGVRVERTGEGRLAARWEGR